MIYPPEAVKTYDGLQRQFLDISSYLNLTGPKGVVSLGAAPGPPIWLHSKPNALLLLSAAKLSDTAGCGGCRNF